MVPLSSPQGSQSVMLPQAQYWYLTNATLGLSAGEGGGVQQKVQCAGESWRRERGGNGGAGLERKRAKWGVWAEAAIWVLISAGGHDNDIKIDEKSKRMKEN